MSSAARAGRPPTAVPTGQTRPPRAVTEVRAIAVRPGRHLELPELLATEEPMEIRAAGPGQDSVAVAVTMRTPGHDFDLAAGFLVTEGLVRPDEIEAVGYCDAVDLDEGRYNAVTVALRRPWDDGAARRNFLTTSSCGVCGKTSIDQVELFCPVVPPGPAVDASRIRGFPDRLRKSQRVFEQTGGLHAAGLFASDGELVALREDVGRHNAVDKVVGDGVLRHSPPPPGAVLVVSGRVSFEITQKAAMAGIGVIAAVSAPSSLAVSAADRLGVTVAAFVRGEKFNVYSHPERIAFEA